MLPERIEPAPRSRSVVRAAVSPTSLVLAGAGVAIGLLLIHSVIIAIVLGAGAWLGRMAVFALLRSLPTADPNQVDPYAVPEPWRQYVRQAVAAGERFDRTVAGWSAGPLRDRVAVVQPRIRQGVQEVWSVARQGAASTTTIASPTVEQLSEELQTVQAARRRPGGDDAALSRREEAVAAQLRAAKRSHDGADRVLDRLRLLTAQLDEAVTQVLELGLDQTGVDAVAGTVDALVEELGSLHAGMQQASAGELDEPPPTPGLPPGPPSSSTAP